LSDLKETSISEETIQQQMDNNGDATAIASSMLYLYIPKFNAAVGKLSSNALRRVLNKLVEWPLNNKSYKATSQVEQDAFNIGSRLLEAKFMLVTAEYSQLIEQQLKEQDNKGESNG